MEVCAEGVVDTASDALERVVGGGDILDKQHIAVAAVAHLAREDDEARREGLGGEGLSDRRGDVALVELLAAPVRDGILLADKSYERARRNPADDLYAIPQAVAV